jgi:hypothetical protein
MLRFSFFSLLIIATMSGCATCDNSMDDCGPVVPCNGSCGCDSGCGSGHCGGGGCSSCGGHDNAGYDSSIQYESTPQYSTPSREEIQATPSSPTPAPTGPGSKSVMRRGNVTRANYNTASPYIKKPVQYR